jgi:DnaD/phage-associated family protein
MSKEAYYFSHDSNARNDPKILALRSEYDIQGYGIYWVIIEMLREQEDFKLPKKNYIWNAIAMQVHSNDFAKEDAKSFVEFCINDCDLFVDDEKHFWSNSLLKRMEKKNELSEKRAAAAKKRWQKPAKNKDSENDDDANAMQKHANAEQNDARKGKEIKERKGKETKTNKTDAGGVVSENVFNFYQQNFGPINSFMSESIGYWIDEAGEPLVIASMKVALENQKKWKYAEGVLKNWLNEGIKSVDQIPKAGGKQNKVDYKRLEEMLDDE